MKIEIPEGYAIVRAPNEYGEPVRPVPEDDYHFVVIHPSKFRFVPQAMVDEYAGMRARHDREHAEFMARLEAMPQVHVTASAKATA